jgi:hypothetical protein
MWRFIETNAAAMDTLNDRAASNAEIVSWSEWDSNPSYRSVWTASATMQCIYSSVSKASLQKTGVLLNSAGDFRQFSSKKFENGATGDFQQLEKPAIGGPFCH